MRGRPTKYKKVYCKRIKELMAEGLSKEACAGELKINKDTLYEWIKKYPEFSDSIKEGEALSLAFWERLGIEGTSGKLIGFNSSSWIFNMKNRAHWRDKPVDEDVNAGVAEALKTLAEKLPN